MAMDQAQTFEWLRERSTRLDAAEDTITELRREIAILKDGRCVSCMEPVNPLHPKCACIRAEIEGYRQTLERTVEALNAENARERRQHPDPQFASMVRDLGKRIGYGVLMTEASRLWAEEVGGGAFAVGHCISIVEAADREARRVLAGKGQCPKCEGRGFIRTMVDGKRDSEPCSYCRMSGLAGKEAQG